MHRKLKFPFWKLGCKTLLLDWLETTSFWVYNRHGMVKKMTFEAIKKIFFTCFLLFFHRPDHCLPSGAFATTQCQALGSVSTTTNGKHWPGVFPIKTIFPLFLDCLVNASLGESPLVADLHEFLETHRVRQTSRRITGRRNALSSNPA